MKLEDVLFHWLQMRVVEERRPDDQAAKETTRLFAEILRADFQIVPLRYKLRKEEYVLHYLHEREEKTVTFFQEAVDKLYEDIASLPE